MERILQVKKRHLDRQQKHSTNVQYHANCTKKEAQSRKGKIMSFSEISLIIATSFLHHIIFLEAHQNSQKYQERLIMIDTNE